MIGWIKRTCTANGINLHYMRTGGDKPSVVLLHGLLLNGACWTPLARALAKEYDLIMPDARGHGYSSAPNQGYSYDTLAADVLGLMEVLELNSPVLLGHSMGGMTAAVVASRNPQRLRGLILAEPTFLSPQVQRAVYESDVVEQHRRILNQSKEAYLAESLARHSRRPRETVELFTQARFQTSIHALEILTLPNPDYLQLVTGLNVPSLLIVGDDGSVITPEVAAELAGLNQHLETLQITEAGHAVPYDQPERFAKVVHTFLHSLRSL